MQRGSEWTSEGEPKMHLCALCRQDAEELRYNIRRIYVRIEWTLNVKQGGTAELSLLSRHHINAGMGVFLYPGKYTQTDEKE